MRMCRWLVGAFAALMCTQAFAEGVTPVRSPTPILERFEAVRVAQARTCKAVSSCEEAVRLWCGGYRRADGDKDGIPCENVCSTLEEVEAIKAEIGC